jgi:ABC-type phosphate transport system substrate-binding protein
MHRRTLTRAIPAALAVAAGLALSAPAAHADFTTPPCEGGDVLGEGATFQGNAQAAWIADFAGNCDGMNPFFGVIAYTESGSGAGRRAFGGGTANGARDVERYIGFDEPPTVGEQAQMEAGTSAPNDQGELHTIPVAGGAITVSVNFPNGCTLPDGAANKDGTGSLTDGVGTARFTAASAVLEQAFAGDAAADTWGELVPGITGTGCSAKPIVRAVRQDSSGTTFAFKQWLAESNSGRGWETLGNTEWPNQTTVVRGEGNNGVADQIEANDGSIGYVDLASARDNGFSEAAGSNDDEFWIRIHEDTGVATEPLVDPAEAGHTSSTRGANCDDPSQFGDTPASTLDNWRAVSGIAPDSGYAICTPTYAGAWDDYATVYGNTAAEELKARTVNDYLRYATSSRGQQVASDNDYSPLPSTPGTGETDSVQEIAQAGAAAIGWDK